MTSKLSILIGIVLGIVLLSYMFVFQVQHDEVAVLTTFNNTEAPVRLTSSVRAADMPASQPVEDDATFQVRINERDPVQITVPADALRDNADADDPMAAAQADLQQALAQAELSNRLAVSVADNRLELALIDAGSQDTLAIPRANDAAHQALGFDKHVARAGSLYDEPGLKFRLPYPIQKVYKYPRKLYVLEDQPQQVRTADGHSVIVRTYMTWRIARPYQFYQNTGATPAEAEKTLRSLMSRTYGVMGQYQFSDLVDTTSETSSIETIERAWLQALRDELSANDANSGIEIEHVGIRRMMLPEATTDEVFESMANTRQRMAEDALSSGRAEAATIKSQAESSKQMILAFANRRAEEIRSEGDEDANAYLSVFAENPELANFLREVEADKKILSHNTTFLFDARNVFDLLMEDTPSSDSQISGEDSPSQETSSRNAAPAPRSNPQSRASQQ